MITMILILALSTGDAPQAWYDLRKEQTERVKEYESELSLARTMEDAYRRCGEERKLEIISRYRAKLEEACAEEKKALGCMNEAIEIAKNKPLKDAEPKRADALTASKKARESRTDAIRIYGELWKK